MLHFALRFLHRDWRAGELNLLALAMIICVASITTVGFFTNRVERAMQQQSSELLAADFVISSRAAIDPQRINQARQDGLQISRMENLRSVVLAGDQVQLVEVKAVDAHYPLRGELMLSDRPYSSEYAASGAPTPGHVWVAARLLQAMQLKIGSKVTLGSREFIIDKVVAYEPDRGGDFFRMAPRLIMNRDDMASTQLVQPGSRINHRLLVAGPESALNKFTQSVRQHPEPGEELISIRDGRPEIRFAYDRADFFLNIVALISVLLGSIATAMAAQRYTRRHVDTVAILRAQGLTQGRIFGIFLLEMFVFALIVSLLGSLVGYFAQFALSEIMANLIVDDLPQPGLTPLFTGTATGMIALLGFVMPPIWLLKQAPPIRVLRRDQSVSVFSRSFVILFIGSIFVLWVWRLGDTAVVQYILAGTIGTLLALYFTAKLMVMLLKPLRGLLGVSWRYGLANLTRRSHLSSLQITAFGLGIMFILLNGEIRSDLLGGWRNTMPTNTPNYFLTNVQKNQLAGIHDLFVANGITPPPFAPMVRGRLLAINGKPVHADDFEHPQAKNLILHEFNLSWRKDLPEGNHIIDGRWWRPDEVGKHYMSLDPTIARRFHLKVGDHLTFNIAGNDLELELLNTRGVDWGTFRVNFFTLFAPGLLEEYPANWVASLHLDKSQSEKLVELVRQYPNVSIIDIDVIITRIRHLMDRISLAVEYLLGFTLLIGVIIMLTALKTTQDERQQEAALLHTLGASRRWILKGVISEFLLLGAIAGGIAGLAAAITGKVLAEQVFKFSYDFSLAPILYGSLSGALAIAFIGFLGTNRVLSQPPITTFRHA